jgi:hypothetical protein
MGRGEKFYKYNSFSRDISFSFTVVAEGPNALKLMYSKLNQLAASLAPTYTDAGYMSGNMHKVTIGKYLDNQWGIMGGFTYEVIDDSPWEITKGMQVPLYIKVSGVKFTPIHNFRPQSYFNGINQFIYQDVTTNTTAPHQTATAPEEMEIPEELKPKIITDTPLIPNYNTVLGNQGTQVTGLPTNNSYF